MFRGGYIYILIFKGKVNLYTKQSSPSSCTEEKVLTLHFTFQKISLPVRSPTQTSNWNRYNFITTFKAISLVPFSFFQFFISDPSSCVIYVSLSFLLVCFRYAPVFQGSCSETAIFYLCALKMKE